MSLTNEDLQAIIDRECNGLLESGLRHSARDIVDEMAKEILMLRKEADRLFLRKD